MAVLKSCSKCDKGKGAYVCVGCEAYFCKKCHQLHRENLANQIAIFVGERNGLRDKINKANQSKELRSPILAQIDDWQRITIEKVGKVAEQARQQVIRLLNSKKTNIKGQFENFSQELIHLKKTEDFVEHDLKRLEERVHQLNQELKGLSEPPDIELYLEQSNRIAWDSLIYIKEKSFESMAQQQQGVTEKWTNDNQRGGNLTQQNSINASSLQKQVHCTHPSFHPPFD